MLRITFCNVDDFVKSRNTVAARKPNGNGENKHQPAASGETGLLDSINSITGARGMSLASVKKLNLIEDIRRGIRQVVSAPEMTVPEGSDKIVCHNGGCGH